MAPCPTSGATCVALGTALSASRNWPKVFQRQGAVAQVRISVRLSLFADARRGPGAGVSPQLPVTWVVTPWRIVLSARPSARSAMSEWVWISTNPGPTTHPVASSRRPQGPP